MSTFITLRYEFLNDLIEVSYVYTNGSTRVTKCTPAELSTLIENWIELGFDLSTDDPHRTGFSSNDEV
jgi:hypothetical protein